ncbi:MAG: hypothetical protein U0794_20105 [Isosphaeraceae bacterium]
MGGRSCYSRLRLPALIASAMIHTVLTACRREDWSLRLMLGQLAASLALVTLAANGSGPHGVALVILALEWAGLIAAGSLLGRLDLGSGVLWPPRGVWIGVCAMIGLSYATPGWPLALELVVATVAYGVLAGPTLWRDPWPIPPAMRVQP